jgi:hypothetical protein
MVLGLFGLCVSMWEGGMGLGLWWLWGRCVSVVVVGMGEGWVVWFMWEIL